MLNHFVKALGSIYFVVSFTCDIYIFPYFIFYLFLIIFSYVCFLLEFFHVLFCCSFDLTELVVMVVVRGFVDVRVLEKRRSWGFGF